MNHSKKKMSRYDRTILSLTSHCHNARNVVEENGNAWNKPIHDKHVSDER